MGYKITDQFVDELAVVLARIQIGSRINALKRVVPLYLERGSTFVEMSDFVRTYHKDFDYLVERGLLVKEGSDLDRFKPTEFAIKIFQNEKTYEAHYKARPEEKWDAKAALPAVERKKYTGCKTSGVRCSLDRDAAFAAYDGVFDIMDLNTPERSRPIPWEALGLKDPNDANLQVMWDIFE